MNNIGYTIGSAMGAKTTSAFNSVRKASDEEREKKRRRKMEERARRKTNRSHSANVEDASKTRSWGRDEGSIASRGTRPVGRSYNDPERIAERVLRQRY